MKKFLLPLVVALISLTSCTDYTDDFNAIDNRLDALEQAVPSIEEQIESINTQLTSLKATDEAIKEQISELEKSDKATATEIADLKQKDSALEKSITDLQNYVDTQIANAKSEAAAAYATVEQYNTIVAQLGALQSSTSKLGEELTAKIDAEVKSLTDKIADLEARLKAVEDKVENLLARIQSVAYVPQYEDGKATVTHLGRVGQLSLDFEISPKDAVAELASVWQEAVSIKVVYTQTRAVEFIDMPIVEFVADAESGVVSVTASGDNLSAEFFAGKQSASVRLAISDGNNSVVSEYVQMTTKEITDEIWYTSTDGAIIVPPCGNETESATEFDTFGANIVSNTYENGLGVIKFDGPISKIGRRAFYKCSTLKTITHPHTVLEIGDLAFYECSKLSDFVFLDGLTSIGSMAFSKAYKSTTVTLPESITHIGNGAFGYCEKIESFYGKFASEDNKCLVYNGALIRLANVKGDYVLPEGIITVGARSISGFSEQVSLTMPESLQSLPTSSPITETANVVAFKGKFATEDNRSLIYNNILFGVAQYGLTEYSVPEGVTKLSDWLLMTAGGGNYLETVVLPSTLTDVGINQGSVFHGCRKLKYLYCRAVNPPTMHGSMDSMFKYINPLPTIYVPAISVDAYKSAEGWKEFADYIVGFDF